MAQSSHLENARSNEECKITDAAVRPKPTVKVFKIFEGKRAALRKEVFVNEEANETIEIPARGYSKQLERSKCRGLEGRDEVKKCFIEGGKAVTESVERANEDPRPDKKEPNQVSAISDGSHYISEVLAISGKEGAAMERNFEDVAEEEEPESSPEPVSDGERYPESDFQPMEKTGEGEEGKEGQGKTRERETKGEGGRKTEN